MALHEDDNLHIDLQAKNRKQMVFYRTIHSIDRWGEILTAITVAGGLVIAAVYIYQVWEIRSRLPG